MRIQGSSATLRNVIDASCHARLYSMFAGVWHRISKLHWLTASRSAPKSIVSLKIEETVQAMDPLVVGSEEPASSTDPTIENLPREALANKVMDFMEETNQVNEPECSPN